jgi:PIN domain nuclease of toxin-antitoxin system
VGVAKLRALFDTHALIWWFSDDISLTPTVRAIIADTQNELLVSAASAWEIAIKHRLGKLRKVADLVSNFSSRIEREGFQLLPISAEHAVRAGLLPGVHKDPFDRMLIAQAQAENTPILSIESIFESYGVRRLW